MSHAFEPLTPTAFLWRARRHVRERLAGFKAPEAHEFRQFVLRDEARACSWASR